MLNTLMNRQAVRRVTNVVAWSVVLGCACNEVKVDPTDRTPPEISFLVRAHGQTQYLAAVTAQLAATRTDQLEIECDVSDPEGVKSISLSFITGTDYCTLNNGAVWMGDFGILPRPDPLQQTIQPDADGNVYNELLLQSTLEAPFHCDVPGVGTGVPYGAQIKVSCSGSNWSSDPTKATAERILTVNLY